MKNFSHKIKSDVRCTQIDSKQQVRMNLGVKLILLLVVRHTQIHLLDSVHLYWRGQTNLGLPKVILNIKFTIC